MSDIIVGLDIGTSFVRAVIGEFTENDTIQIIGVGKSVSTGLRNGAVVNIEATMRALKEAIEAAEMVSGYEVMSCVTGIGGLQIESLNSKGLVAVTGKGKSSREITQADVTRVIEAAKAVVIPMDRQILHVVPQSYIVDGQRGIKNPKDMIGIRLEAEVHIITASVTAVQNIQRCVDRAGYKIDGVMLKTLAATQAVMTEEELELGSILIDLGGGTTDALVLVGGAPVCTVSVPVGSSFVTNDIAVVKGISFETAERIKLKSGCCWEPLIDSYEEVIIPGVGGRAPEAISRVEICQIIQARMEELFEMVRSEIVKKSNLTQLSGNVVLVGGGALLPGVVELAQSVFKTTSVRIGIPGNLGGIMEEYRTPEYATVAGLILSNLNLRRRIDIKHNNKYNERENTKKSGGNLGKKLSDLFKEFF
ncbi:cell division protein FtsA [Treponema brennaborense]|uniref:Cell division protein FtsA n=1 Tax=Treponema brennaborense (strain DSM 12168 / CIP 105900 / DD5/3) TaxID=906968 RepID=F4LJJ3_TREBD|nr:cell division protein FtsA [Treponema brennaborense]AEE16388.1 cell division protein FtsA [Treponema brennaborense DSM 12168]